MSEIKVYVDISSYWPLKEGKQKSVNSVYEMTRDSPNRVGRSTLRLALEGKLDRGYFSSLVKLAKLCSEWSGKEVSVNDLVKVTEKE